jgi:hypothetical protein
LIAIKSYFIPTIMPRRIIAEIGVYHICCIL